MSGAGPSLSPDELQCLLGQMIAARSHSKRLFALQRQGRIGTFAPLDGQEAAVLGSVAALDPSTDWVVPQYREPVALARYGEDVLTRVVLGLMGHPAGGHYPEGVRIFPTQISLAAQVPHALGLAWGMKRKGERGVVAVYFGDGASSEGDFYEAANFAGVLRAPLLLICVNNHWAISTPLAKQTAAPSLAAKAAAFGFPGVQVDGNDAVAVHGVTAEARERALAGDGPTLIETVTYRMAAHTTADDPTRYVPAAELAEWAERDPIVRLRVQLEVAGLWDDAHERAAEADAETAMEAALTAVAGTPPPTPAAMLDHVFAQPTPRLARQRAEIEACRGRGA